MDKDVCDSVFTQVDQHPLQLGALRSLGALASINELLDDSRTKRSRLGAAGLSLGRDRQTFPLAVACRLIS